MSELIIPPEVDPAVRIQTALYDMNHQWQQRPHYTTFSLESSLARINDVHNTVRRYSNADPVAISEAYDGTIEFFRRAFERYASAAPLGDETPQRAFAVPMRISRNNESYASEVTPFAPLLDPKFGINADIRQRTVVGLPPTVLETYTATTGDIRGVLLLTPLFEDMTADYIGKGGLLKHIKMMQLGRAVRGNINETARFAAEQLGVRVMGLGAIIPKLTAFGTTIKQPGLETTTGHGGTVYLIAETTKKIIEEHIQQDEITVGIIGASGSIGYSSLDVIAEQIPHALLSVFDKRQQKLQKLIHEREDSAFIHQTKDILSVLEQSDVIVTAVTTPIDLDREDPDRLLDLTGKWIVDDSQPGSFEREQVEARGGKLVWVVGSDETSDRSITRDSGYNFGDEAGLYGPRSIWGCEAEAAVVGAQQDMSYAIREQVNPRHVRSIAMLCRAAGVGVADWQSYGKPVHID